MSYDNALWKEFPEGLREWMKSEKTAPDSRDVSDDLMRQLKEWVDRGDVSPAHGNQAYFDLLEAKYPIGLNRIDWRGVPSHQVVDVLPMEDGLEISFESHVHKLISSRVALVELLASGSVDASDSVIWIGDGCDLCLHMTVGTFLECYVVLFASSQHSYVIPANAEWCLNYTLEGQLFFGKTENSIATGVVDLDFGNDS